MLSARALAALPDVRPGDDLAALVAAAAPADLGDGDVLVVAHKVVSKAEGRVRALDAIEPGERARALAAEHGKDPRLVQAVLDESAELLRAHEGVFICATHHGFVCANAGVDQSNASQAGELVLLPRDPDGSARGCARASPRRAARARRSWWPTPSAAPGGSGRPTSRSGSPGWSRSTTGAAAPTPTGATCA